MKNLYSKAVISSWLNALKKDFSFYNSNTELLAIWTVLFMTITGLFVVGLRSKISVIPLLLILSFITTLATVIFTTYYLHTIKYHNKKHLFSKAHNFLNKSFKVRSLFRLIKSYASFFLSQLKNFKNLTKRNLKFAS